VGDRLLKLKPDPRSANPTRRELLTGNERSLFHVRRATAMQDVVNAWFGNDLSRFSLLLNCKLSGWVHCDSHMHVTKCKSPTKEWGSSSG